MPNSKQAHGNLLYTHNNAAPGCGVDIRATAIIITEDFIGG